MVGGRRGAARGRRPLRPGVEQVEGRELLSGLGALLTKILLQRQGSPADAPLIRSGPLDPSDEGGPTAGRGSGRPTRLALVAERRAGRARLAVRAPDGTPPRPGPLVGPAAGLLRGPLGAAGVARPSPGVRPGY